MEEDPLRKRESNPGLGVERGGLGGAFPLGQRGDVLSGNCEAETPVEKKESVELRLTC